MRSINKVILVGNLGRDPEVRTFQSGDQVANLRVATGEQWKDRNTGEQRERTEWHTVSVFGPLARVIEQHARKGARLYVEGQLQTRKWQDQAGQDRFTTEIVVRPYRGEILFLDRREGGAPAGGQGNGYGGSYGGGGAGQGAAGDHQGAPSRDLDDEIPF